MKERIQPNFSLDELALYVLSSLASDPIILDFVGKSGLEVPTEDQVAHQLAKQVEENLGLLIRLQRKTTIRKTYLDSLPMANAVTDGMIEYHLTEYIYVCGHDTDIKLIGVGFAELVEFICQNLGQVGLNYLQKNELVVKTGKKDTYMPYDAGIMAFIDKNKMLIK